MKLQGATVNIMGDSITEGVGASCPENAYPAVLEREFGLRKVNNYGISGSRIARQQVITDNAYDRDFCMRVREMDPSADAVVIFGGTNDFGHGEAPLGYPTDRTPCTFWGACHYLMNELITLYCGKPILILTPLRRLQENDPRGDGTGRKPYGVATLRDYRAILMSVAEQYALPVLDLYTTSGIVPENPVCRKRLIPDGLHPSDEGHALIARRIAHALEQL